MSAGRPRALRHTVSAAGVGAVVFWGVLQGVFLFVPPLAAIPLNLGIAAAFVWWFVLRPRAMRDMRRRATLRLRGMGAAARWLPALAAILVAHVLSYLVVVPRFLAFPSTANDPVEAYTRRPFGTLAIVVLAGVVAPLLEEFLFRGWLQRTLERRHAATFAIVVTAVAFSAVHLDTFGFVIRLSFGLLVGYVAFASRSVWPGVVLHAAYNVGLAVAGGAMPNVDEATLTAWAHTPRIFWPALATWMTTSLLLVWGARSLAEAVRDERGARVGRVN